MRAFCTVSAPLEGCAPPATPLSPGSRFLALKLLGSLQPLYFLVEAKSRVREVYAQTCLHFAKQGMLDTELFGLAVLSDGEYLFADPESKLSKYGPKSWRSSHTHGLDANGKPLLELHFRVQFYVESPLMLRDEVSRHYYYLQLKANVVAREQPKECNDQSMLLLGGLALQADLGDVPTNTTGGRNNNNNTTSPEGDDDQPCSSSTSRLPVADYFRAEDYIPYAMRSTWGNAAIQSCHREYRGMSSADAETRYIREACNMGDCSINAHLFRMRQSKSDTGPGNMLLVVYAKGIKVIAAENGQETSFLWPSITKLSFERKKFEIRSGEDRVTLYSLSDDKNKMLLSLCRETHQFSMKIAPRLTEAIKREEEETSSIHTQYMYSRSLHHHLPPYHKAKNDQRISVISSTSSNTTSGIISDRVHSEDELEIMINCPPVAPIAAPSTESLALAHLLDRPSVSRQTSCAGELRESDLEGDGMKTPDEQKAKEDTIMETSPKSMHNMGSQSSSTCSTVVIATTDSVTTTSSSSTSNPMNQSTVSVESGSGRRQLSTCSSLELGYSHTAQNSSLSEVQPNQGDEDDDNGTGGMSGVYTLAHAAPPTETSGVYTMNSSEMTGQSSEIAESVSESHDSSHYGCFQPMMMDTVSVVSGANGDGGGNDMVDGGKFIPRLADVHRVDGEDAFRLRSNSTISAAGSFRGDGSDPADKKHVLLSAEELTDLIVGRGTYPNRKTVSDNLDCDCDYVTLPLPLEGDSYIQGHRDTAPSEDAFDDEGAAVQPPPAPPKRIDSVAGSLRPGVAGEIKGGSLPPPPPPPYNARHETTGLCGPSVKLPVIQSVVASPVVVPSVVAAVPEEVPILPLRDPPPYPQQPIRYTAPPPVPASVPTPPAPLSTTTTSSSLPEEAAARFIKTRPNINILKAHTSVVGEKPSFAAPTLAPQHPPLPQPAHSSASSNAGGLQGIPSTTTIGIPMMPYKIHTAHKSMSALHHPTTTYLDAKSATPRTCVLLPVIKPRQFLPPPPPTLPRQPPPPPPNSSAQLATVYTSQLARSQIELYQQQLYSDVDYVIYPIQDPAVSQQEYLDAKQGSILAAMAAQGAHPPPYLATAAAYHPYPGSHGKTHALYRSTPFLPIQMPMSARYASTQNLSDTYVQLPGTYSPMYSPSVASLCSSYTCEPPPPLPPVRPHSMVASSGGGFSRSRSDDNILNSIETMPRSRRLPPPPPTKGRVPAYEMKRINKPPIPTPVEEDVTPPPVPAKTFQVKSQTVGRSSTREIPAPQTAQLTANGGSSLGTTPPGQSVDIQLIRERSKNLDLPLIAALCNDRSLLKQTKAFVMPKHAGGSPGAPTTVNGQSTGGALPQVMTTVAQKGAPNVTISNSPQNGTLGTNRSKYPVSGLNTLQLNKPKKTTVSHRHPQDKLPPLPGQTNGIKAGNNAAEGNNYVMDPIKHKAYNSQPGV